MIECSSHTTPPLHILVGHHSTYYVAAPRGALDLPSELALLHTPQVEPRSPRCSATEFAIVSRPWGCPGSPRGQLGPHRWSKIGTGALHAPHPLEDQILDCPFSRDEHGVSGEPMQDAVWSSESQTTIASLYEERLHSDPSSEYLDVCGTKLTAADVVTDGWRVSTVLDELGLAPAIGLPPSWRTPPPPSPLGPASSWGDASPFPSIPPTRATTCGINSRTVVLVSSWSQEPR